MYGKLGKPPQTTGPMRRTQGSDARRARLTGLSGVIDDGPGATAARLEANRIGDFRIPFADVRAGIVSPAVYPALFSNNFKTWALEHDGCILSRGISKQCVEGGSTFNIFPPDMNPEIEWSETSDTVHNNVIGEVAKGAVLTMAKLPYLKHEATLLRPTLLMFTVTGHVMAAIYFHTERGGELHILNPWPLGGGGEQQIGDVYTILKTVLEAGAYKIRVIDVAEEVQKYAARKVKAPVQINLQEGEKIGYCTLWVGILSHAVLTTPTVPPPAKGPPAMTFLENEVNNGKTVGDYQLSQGALDFYLEVYRSLTEEKDRLVTAATKAFGLDNCSEAAAAQAAITLAKRAAAERGKGGKRTKRRRTFRKRKLQWKSRLDPQSTFTTSRRRTRKSRRGGKGSSAY